MISLCSFVKDEAHCIGGMFESVKKYVDEIVIVDTGSTDGTQEICRKYGARVYEVGFTDFGKIRTLAMHLARNPFVLMLDADERLEGADHLEILAFGIDFSENEKAVAFPRKRWLDIHMEQQTELEAYPDLQVRFFRNNLKFSFKRELHEYFDGTGVRHVDYPIIHHFHDVFKSPEALQKRNELYTRLAAQAGVNIEGGKKL